MKIRKVFEVAELIASTRRARDRNTYVFGSWYGEKFADNPKFLYLYYLKRGKNANWVTRSIDVYEYMKREGLPVFLVGTNEEVEVSRRAKYFFYCCSLDDIDKYNAGGAVMINLWHGIPLKKVMYDDTYNYNTVKKPLYDRMSEKLMNTAFSNTYVVSTSKTMSKIYEGAFRKKSDHILNLGQPRNDIFFESRLTRKKYGDIQYKTLITYMPTMRNMGKDHIDLNEILDLKRLNDLCKEHDALFLIKKHFCHRNEFTDLNEFSNIVDMTTSTIDSQELLYSTDVLITDYSSCYIDYMLLDRPIIFYPYDLQEYLSKDREMYFSYEDMTPGKRAESFNDLFDLIKDTLNGQLTVDEKFKRIKDIYYDPENQGPVSQKIMEAVNQIDNAV